MELDTLGTSDTPLRAAYAQLRQEAFSPLKSPRRWVVETWHTLLVKLVAWRVRDD